MTFQVLLGKVSLKLHPKKNIMNGFKTNGVHLMDRDIFSDDDFAPGFITDRPMREESAEQEEVPIAYPLHDITYVTDEQPTADVGATLTDQWVGEWKTLDEYVMGFWPGNSSSKS